MKSLPNKSTRIFFVVIALLVLTNVATLIWIYMHPHSIEGRIAEYPLIDFSRHFVAQEDFITNIQPLRERIINIVETRKLDSSSIYFEFLRTGANISINPDVRVYPASLLKLPTAVAVMSKVEQGEWRLDNKLVLFESDIDPNYGDLFYWNAVGTTFTIEELLKAMLIESDNTAHQMVLRNLSSEDLTVTLNSVGLEEILVENRRLSAKEYSRLFRALYYASALNREHSEQLLRWLTETTFDNYLQPGIPEGVPFAHKIGKGELQRTYLDSGIVYVPNRPYLLTVAIADRDEEEAAEIMREISEAVYTYVANY